MTLLFAGVQPVIKYFIWLGEVWLCKDLWGFVQRRLSNLCCQPLLVQLAFRLKLHSSSSKLINWIYWLTDKAGRSTEMLNALKQSAVFCVCRVIMWISQPLQALHCLLIHLNKFNICYACRLFHWLGDQFIYESNTFQIKKKGLLQHSFI